MKKLKLLLLTRFISKSQGHSFNNAGSELLETLYLELGDVLDINVEGDVDEQEMGFKSNG